MGRATARDETVRTRVESGQDITNTPPSCPDGGRVKKRKGKIKGKEGKRRNVEKRGSQGSGTTPRAERCLENAGNGSGFVNISAVMSAVGIQDVSNEPSSIFSRMKW
jgi:hypothetical protein